MSVAATGEQELLELLPEISLVESGANRSAIIAVWQEMQAAGGHDDLGQALFFHGTSYTLVEHVRAVTRAADALCDIISECHQIEVDKESVLVAALLHDVSYLVEHAPDGRLTVTGELYPHTFLAVEAARAHGLPDKIVNLIVTHTPKIKQLSPYVVEAKILEHADLASAEVLVAARDGRRGPAGKLAFRT